MRFIIVYMKRPWLICFYSWITVSLMAMMSSPARLLAQIPSDGPNKLDAAIPRISQTNSSIPPYLLSGLALILVVLIAFRSAHRGSRRGGRDEAA